VSEAVIKISIEKIIMNNKLNNTIENKSDYELFLENNRDVAIIIIEANWSGNCKIMEPIIEKLKNQFACRIRFLTVKSELSMLFNLNGDSDVLPKFLFFNRDKIVDRVFGTASIKVLEEKMNALLKVSSKNNLFNKN
jgi:thiol-disulfide isomerase/thioredoxin